MDCTHLPHGLILEIVRGPGRSVIKQAALEADAAVRQGARTVGEVFDLLAEPDPRTSWPGYRPEHAATAVGLAWRWGLIAVDETHPSRRWLGLPLLFERQAEIPVRPTPLDELHADWDELDAYYADARHLADAA
jgi:hypothetical protein